MPISYRPYEPQQEMLLPASLQDRLPKGHLATDSDLRPASSGNMQGASLANQPSTRSQVQPTHTRCFRNLAIRTELLR